MCFIIDIKLGVTLQQILHRDIIQCLVDNAEYLSEEFQQQSTEFVLFYSDIYAGNVLITNNGTLYILDWDKAIMAPKNYDLMFIGGEVGNVWNNPHIEEFFYTGCGKNNVTILF